MGILEGAPPLHPAKDHLIQPESVTINDKIPESNSFLPTPGAASKASRGRYFLISPGIEYDAGFLEVFLDYGYGFLLAFFRIRLINI